MTSPACWCGNSTLVPFRESYSRCAACETIVFLGERPANLAQVSNEQEDFYGRSYWYERQVGVHGLPDLDEKARRDLTERCPTWLRILMGYCLPPARVLEIGAAHGGLVAMARWAGFDATGLEVSPYISDWACAHFGVPMMIGPLEEQILPPESFDAIILLDVLEHLPDPKTTLARCRELLAPEGILVIQTPEYPAGRSFEDLTRSSSDFLKMLIPVEHLFLFSRSSVQLFLARLGFTYSVFEPGLSPAYNMTFVSSAAPLVRHRPDEIRAALLSTPSGRLVDAFLSFEAAGPR